jgi:pimeloyl-ACP methyl ester carboxylesterase
VSISGGLLRRLGKETTMRLTIFTIALVLALTSFARAEKARINGMDLYYEIHGTGAGRPLVVLHGAFCTIEACFGDLLPGLSKGRKVIAIEMQGHGHTADIDRPLSTKLLAGDVATLMKKLKISEVDVLGYSMGGGVAIELVRAQPALVKKLVLVGTPVSPDGWHPGMLDGIKQIDPEAFKQTPWYAAYTKVAPKPEQWSRLVKKVAGLDLVHGWKLDELAQIKVPVLYMIGDSDIVRPEHAVEVFRAFGGGVAGDIVGLPKSRLAIVPGATHVTVVHEVQIVTPIVSFLDAK